MAVLLPALSKARDLAKRIVCANHLKTLMTANLIYSQSCDGNFVPINYASTLLLQEQRSVATPTTSLGCRIALFRKIMLMGHPS